MKKLLTTATFSMLMCGALLAQPPFGPHATGSGSPPDAATRIADQVKRLTTLLDLTTAQANQITSILTSANATTTTARTTIQTDQTALTTAIKSNATATITQLSTAIGVLNGQILAAQAGAEASIYVLLTSAQQTKLDTIGGINALGGGPGGGPGGPGGHGPGGPPHP